MKNKKIVIGIIILILIIIISILSIIMIKPNSKQRKIEKGYQIFGDEYCSGHIDETGLTVITKYTCEICGSKQESGHAPAQKICKECSSITGRCTECGKLLKK